MPAFKPLCAALLVAATISPVAIPAVAATGPAASGATAAGAASLAVKPDAAQRAGVVYGITAVDAHPQAFGDRARVSVAAGLRTIRYACPAGPGAELTREFVAGAHYELICKAGASAEIRRVDDC